MIKDYALRYFIFRNFIKHVGRDIQDLSDIIYMKIRRRFLKNEEVLIDNRDGIIVKNVKEKYYIMMKKDHSVIKSNFLNIIRKENVDKNIIKDFILFITYDSQFGVKLLKKNIFNFVTDKSNLNGYAKYTKKMLENTSSDEIEGFNNQIVEKEMQIVPPSRVTFDKDYFLGEVTPPQIQKEEFEAEPFVSKNIKNVKNFDICTEIPTSEIYEIPDFNFKYVNKILRIYSFIYNFCSNKVFNGVSISKLLRNFKEQPYISDIIGTIHGFLIENLLEEKKTIGFSNLLSNVKSVMDSVSEDYRSDDIIIGNEVGMRGWKLKSRMLLLDMYKNTNNKTILSYYNVLNKKSPFDAETTVLIRISLVEFLINCYMATNIFRDIILNEIKKVKSLENNYNELGKLLSSRKKAVQNIGKTFNYDTESIKDLQNKMTELKKKIVTSPPKADIGQINNAKFFLVSDKIFISKNNVFYVPSKNTLEVILQKYLPTDKAESNTVLNLKNIIESLY